MLLHHIDIIVCFDALGTFVQFVFAMSLLISQGFGQLKDENNLTYS